MKVFLILVFGTAHGMTTVTVPMNGAAHCRTALESLKLETGFLYDAMCVSSSGMVMRVEK